MAKRTAKRATKKMSFNERVRSVIRGSAETKEKVVNVFNESPINGCGLALLSPIQGVTQPNLLDTLDIEQGTEQEQREGNKIENCKLTVRGFIHSKPSSTTNDSLVPYEVHMVFYKQKKSIDNSNTDLKILPNNNTGHVDGTLMNSVYPYNKDKYIIRKVRVFKLRPLMKANNVAADSQIVNAQNSNAPMFHRFHETIDIHKDLKYNDQSNVPANDWVGVSLFVINGDGTVLDRAQVRASVTMDAVLRYKDL